MLKTKADHVYDVVSVLSDDLLQEDVFLLKLRLLLTHHKSSILEGLFETSLQVEDMTLLGSFKELFNVRLLEHEKEMGREALGKQVRLDDEVGICSVTIVLFDYLLVVLLLCDGLLDTIDMEEQSLCNNR